MAFDVLVISLSDSIVILIFREIMTLHMINQQRVIRMVSLIFAINKKYRFAFLICVLKLSGYILTFKIMTKAS